MKLLALALLVAGCSHTPTHDELRQTALRLVFTNGLCSATAIGPDTLLSARHCFGGKLVSVDGKPVTVVSSRAESRDRIVVKVKGVTFKHWAKRGPVPAQGDHLRFWGNPEGEPNVYREALVARVWKDGIVLQTTVCPGDSGAGLMNALGQVVGVVSAVTGDRVCKFGISL